MSVAASPVSQSLRAAEIRSAVERICASRWLKDSLQLQHFLRYLVEETLAGRADGLKEYSLGLVVFHRGNGYDPRRDAIVRVQATLLRKRLDNYYANEGKAEPFVLSLPRGGYVPQFGARATAPARPPKPASAWYVFASGFGAALVLAGVAMMLVREPAPVRSIAAREGDCPPLWSSFFQPGVRNVVSFGVPLFYSGGGGVFFRDVQINRPGEEQKGSLQTIAGALNRAFVPQEDVYTGIGEAQSMHRLASFFHEGGAAADVVTSRAIGPSDLKDHNLVVVSSLRFQTLLAQFQLPGDFVFDPAGSGAILNTKPAAGERARYDGFAGRGVETAHAVVSLWPGLSPGRRILHIGGVHTWCTQGAAQFVLDPKQLRLMNQRFEDDRRNGRRGPASPFFQILLRVEGKENRLHAVEYVTHHYLPLPDRPLAH
ncbi:MAG: hypothetical protein MUC42_10910 [Bryobacter sp.]|nr:hypothetical protein [Bryobacter sp.]